MKTIRIPLTKAAMLKLALSLQELSQDSKKGFVTLDIETIEGESTLMFIKDTNE